jgi:hypothetical protein
MERTVALPGDAIYRILQRHFRSLAPLGATNPKQGRQAFAPALADENQPIRRSTSAEIAELETIIEPKDELARCTQRLGDAECQIEELSARNRECLRNILARK